MGSRSLLFASVLMLTAVAHAGPTGAEVLDALKAADEIFFRGSHVVGMLDTEEDLTGTPGRQLAVTFAAVPNRTLVR